MAPKGSDAAGSANQQHRARRSLPRIVPAVPLKFSRPPPAVRPITPEERTPDPHTTPDRAVEPPAQVEEEKEEQEQDAATAHAPPTPDSKASAMNGHEVEAKTPASSTVETQEEQAAETVDSRASASAGDDTPSVEGSSLSSAEPVHAGKPAVNGRVDASAAPFYPSDYPHAATPTADIEVSIPEVTPQVARTQSQAGLEHIVFGTAASQSPAVSTPHEQEQEATPHEQVAPRAPPGIAHPQFAVPFYPAHSHHQSDPTTAWLNPAVAAPPPDDLYYGRDPHPSMLSGHVYPGMYQDHFSSPQAPVPTNGISHTPRSSSQSPTKPQSAASKPVSEQELGRHGVSYPSVSRGPAMGPPIDEPLELASYMTSQFGNPEFADFKLRIQFHDGVWLSIPVHGVVVCRSRTVLHAIRSNPPLATQSNELPILDIATADKWITDESLVEAIKVLYGVPLLYEEPYLTGLPPFHPDGESVPTFTIARRRMEQVLSYTAVGVVLQLNSMSGRGAQLARKLLRWDTVDLIASFALESAWDVTLPQNGNGVERSQIAAYEPHSTSLLGDVINFLAYSIPYNFTLYTLAPELSRAPRLPTFVEKTDQSHHARLSKIRFGSHPPEEDSNPSYVTRIMSSILLSLPYPVLQRLFSHPAIVDQLGRIHASNLLAAVVTERESRRNKAVTGKIIPGPMSSLSPSLMDNLYWEERVEPSAEFPIGSQLKRRLLVKH